MRLMAKTFLFCMIMANVFAYDGDIEIVFDDGIATDKYDQTSFAPIQDFISIIQTYNNDMQTKNRIIRNINEFMFHYDRPLDYELAIRVIFENGYTKTHVGSFYPTSEEKIEVLNFLIDEKRVVPDILISRCYSKDVDGHIPFQYNMDSDHLRCNNTSKNNYSVDEHDDDYVLDWLLSKCSNLVHTLPDDGECWYDTLWEMRRLCFHTQTNIYRIEAQETLEKILQSDIITYDEKMEMKRLYNQRFLPYSMAIFLW